MIVWIIALVSPAAALAQVRGTPGDLKGFDQWVAVTMAEWHIPGLAVGVVKDGKVVLAKGYGYRDVEGKLPVTSRTVMGIGSNSKSFTVALMGMLVDEKRLRWDLPVRTYLPDFQMYDEFATREMTPRDLVTHNSGLPRHDNMWHGRTMTREQIYNRLRYLEPSASFRSRYQYQNLMFMTAGYLTEKITNRSWDALVRERIFTPLGMDRTNSSVNDSPASGDFAYPYTWRSDALVRLPFRNIDAIAPAGSINSSIADMLKYIQFRLDRGNAGGLKLLSLETEKQIQSPHMLTAGTLEYDEIGVGTYGLGLTVSTYRGHKVVGHGGGIDGFISAMSWLPEDKIGVMVLTNLSGDNPVPGLVVRMLYDRMLGLPQVDWVARQRKASADAAAKRAGELAARVAARKPGTSPSHELRAYAGRYEHPGYGTLTVSNDGADLVVTLEPNTTARLKHYHYDVWEIEEPYLRVVPFGGLARFTTNLKGEIDRISVPVEPNVADIVFTRIPPATASGGNDR
jgi:CubicO group peptidase (beta-lactamase class C family)